MMTGAIAQLSFLASTLTASGDNDCTADADASRGTIRSSPTPSYNGVDVTRRKETDE